MELIERQAAIDAIDEQIKYCDKALASFDISLKDEYAVKVEKASLNAFKETLKYLPSAQPEEASMILGQSKDGVRLWYQCSACGEPANADDNYCCNCGRKFRNG